MSEHRDSLIETGENAISARWLDAGLTPDSGLSDPELDSETVLDAFLAHPDDLLAVMVEAGAMEQADPGEMRYRRQRTGWYEWRKGNSEDAPRGWPVTFYRRTTEGDAS